MPINNLDWAQNDDAQLSVDVFRRGDMLIIRCLVAGVEPGDMDVSVHGDLLTIRGKRHAEKQGAADDWFYQECFWGSFSRSIVLPYHVASDLTSAELKNGVLEVRIPIKKEGKSVDIEWK